MFYCIISGPGREKTCKTPTSLLSYREKLVYSNLLYSQLRYYTARERKSKALIKVRRLVYPFVVRMLQSQAFSHKGPFCSGQSTVKPR